MSHSTRVEVRRMSHVHQMPQTGRAQIGPVISTTVQKTTPTSAADQRDNVGRRLALDQIDERGYEIDEEQDERGPGRRHVVVENPLHVAHGLFGGRATTSAMYIA